MEQNPKSKHFMQNIIFRLSFLIIVFFAAVSFSNAQQKVLIKTNKGDIEVKLYEETPLHAENFINLIKKDFYDSTLFHRVIADFMIQAGDPNSKNAASDATLGHGGPGYTIPAEINNKFIHKKGALSAARQGDNVNPERRSSGSQFYIVVGRKYPRKYLPRFEETRGEKYTEEQMKVYETIGGTPHLDGEYTVFGEVINGLEIVDQISVVETNKMDRPTEDVIITDIKLID